MKNTDLVTAEKEPVNCEGKQATFVNEKYGTHHRNSFDIWLADSQKPTPLVIYIHGGGFVGGDKSKYYDSEDMVRFLKAGVSVATINYRFMTEEPFGIKASLYDSKRCVQYLRYHAKKYNIDKNRIACSGGSAGAGTSLWLAFSDDMADPESFDPVLRESTRLTCAGAFATQSTYDILQWKEILNVPVAETQEQLRSISIAFGLQYKNGINLGAQHKQRNELDFLKRMDKNSAPIFVFNRDDAEAPTNQDEMNHHPLHAKRIKEKADEVGLEAIVYAPAIGIVDSSGKDLVDFFLEKF